jgi:RHS repeat-associated protein
MFFENFIVPISDYLGSILAVTNDAGDVIAKQNYDARGRKRNLDDWTYANVPSVPGWLYRGFTGHEHLDEFGLINMNGRMYDPVLGRMLSVDNYVAFAFGTQYYNRYSYAMKKSELTPTKVIKYCRSGDRQ